MPNSFLLLLAFSTFCFSSCQSQTTSKQDTDTTHSTPTKREVPNFNYVVEVPTDWTIRDTIMLDGLRIRLLIAPRSLTNDQVFGNILINVMEGRDINEVTTRNMSYLKENMSGIMILERGNIDSTIYDGQWFTYTKEQNGIIRDMINYIIPLNGFAYMITFGSNKGTINKYRATFDKIARSFRG